VVLPNPLTDAARPVRLELLLEGRVDKIHVRLYTSAHILAADFERPGGGPGWMEADLPAESLRRNGIYFAVVTARREAREGSKRVVKLVVLR
jgi:hypothetical protein